MSSTDYYETLELKADCSDADIKKAYRTLAVQWHPAKNESGNKELVVQKFRDISEAYTVLSNAKLRTIFDQYGAKGLKSGVSNGKGGFVTPWSYSENPESQFSDFFGTVSPFADFFSGDSGFAPMFAEPAAAKTFKTDAQSLNLYCSLEELFSGCSKKVRVTRQKLQLDGKSLRSEGVVLTVEVQAGWREGTKITFVGEGDEASGQTTGDVVFILKETPHPRFVRSKNDLTFTAAIDLAQALTGTTIEIKTLDGRTVPVPINEIVKPSCPKIVPNEGMPLPSDPTKRGQLFIQFDVKFPDMLTDTQKVQIQEILANSA